MTRPDFELSAPDRVLRCFFAILILLCAAAFLSACGAKEQSDRTYIPGEFRFTGGSGKVRITCPEVSVQNGKAVAKLVFDSPNYTYVKIDNVQYNRDEENSTENSSVFYAPVLLDEEFPILAQTIAMSTPHEIEYRLLISSKAGEGQGAEGSAPEEGQSTVSFIDPKNVPGLSFKEEMPLDYAEAFSVYYYEEGYKLIEVKDSAQYLLVPEGKGRPEGISEDVVSFAAPPRNVYLAATSVMSFVYAIGAEDNIKLSGTDADGWNIEGPGDAIRSGKMKYAGKYSTPDYELMVGADCDLAIESTMILHSPDVKEKLEELGIPVFIDRSSYEMEPLGRTEWIKAYGALFDLEEQAEEFFEAQKELVQAVEASVGDQSGERPTVAVFAVTTAKSVTVRRSDDYIPRMIEIAGGEYIFPELTDPETKGGTEKISMEEFYSKASDADFLIYNATIENPLKDIASLVDQDALFGEFRAVKEGKVYQIGKDLYQSSDVVGLLTKDIHIMLTGGNESEFTFLEKLP